MPKRGMNIYKRKDGRWEGRIKVESVGTYARKYISIYGKTYGETKKKMEDIKLIAEKKSSSSCKFTFSEAATIWREDRSSVWKPTTHATYLNMLNKHILPKIGEKKLMEIDGFMIEKFVGDIRREKKEIPLSNTYLHNICAVIIKIINHMNRKYHYGLVQPDNPVAQSRKPQMILPTEEKLAILEKYLIEHVQEDTCLGILLAFHTGIRIGELCALTWENIDLKEEVIYIKRNLQRVKSIDGQKNNTQILIQTPKTSSSTRAIPIPPVLFSLLKKYQKEKKDFVISGVKKMWAEPRTIQYRFVHILKECDIANFNFHSLRHAFATRCIAMEFDVKSLSEILGHSSIQITLNLYIHSSMQRKKQLMKRFDLHLYETCNVEDRIVS